MRSYDHTYTDEIVCPHCGIQFTDSWEFEGDDGVIECGNCEKPFSYCREHSITYTTYKEEYETCPMCNEEDVLEEVSRHSMISKRTEHEKLCECCISKLKAEVWRREYCDNDK